MALEQLTPIDHFARDSFERYLEAVEATIGGPERIIPKIIKNYHDHVPLGDHVDIGDHRSESPPLLPSPPTTPEPKRIGILGGGISAVYAAMIFESLGIRPIGSPSDIAPASTTDSSKRCTFEYRIYEAASYKERGGRLYTHKFSESPDDYVEMGAMRFPKMRFMERVFDLFKRIGLGDDDLMKYIMTTDDNLLQFNNITMTRTAYANSLLPAPFGPGSYSYPVVTESLQLKIGKFADAILADWSSGWQMLRPFERYSVRSYMREVEPNFCPQLINWLETFSTGTQAYDSGLAEAVISRATFQSAEWVCVRGGTINVFDKAVKTLKDPKASLRYDSRATGIVYLHTPPPNAQKHNLPAVGQDQGDAVTPQLKVTFRDSQSNEKREELFDHVITTMPFGAFRMLDTSKSCTIDGSTQEAIRALQYGGSCKIGISFKERWWENPSVRQIGGVSYTDRPLRMVIYPSYGIHGNDAAIIVSYTWVMDSLRLGAFMNDEPAKKILLDTVLRDLADLHGIKDPNYLPGLVKDWKPWNWYGSPYSAGAFAFFGPGQFTSMYGQVTEPAAHGLLHFAGEATSAHHGWVLGALNSAWRAVFEILCHEGCYELIEKLKRIWGVPEEWDEDKLAAQVGLGELGFLFEPQLYGPL